MSAGQRDSSSQCQQVRGTAAVSVSRRSEGQQRQSVSAEGQRDSSSQCQKVRGTAAVNVSRRSESLRMHEGSRRFCNCSVNVDKEIDYSL